MNEIFYLDTSIWIDIYDKRDYNGEVAKKLLKKIILHDACVIYSDMHLIEFKRLGFSEYEVNQMLSIAKPDHIKRVHSTKEQVLEANKLKRRNVPFGDALHAVIARDHEAQMVSRDEDFYRLKDIVLTKKPEELI